MSDETRTPNAKTVRSVFVRAHPFSASTSHEDRRAEFDRFISKVKADALREASAGFIDWDALRGYAQVTPEIEESHKSANYLMREADRIEIKDTP